MVVGVGEEEVVACPVGPFVGVGFLDEGGCVGEGGCVVPDLDGLGLQHWVHQQLVVPKAQHVVDYCATDASLLFAVTKNGSG